MLYWDALGGEGKGGWALKFGFWAEARVLGLRVWHGLGLGKVVEWVGWWRRAGAGIHLRGTGGRLESGQRFSSGGNSASLPRGVVCRQFWLSQFAGCGEGCSRLKAGRGQGCRSTYHSAQLAAPTTGTNPETSVVLRRGKAKLEEVLVWNPEKGKAAHSSILAWRIPGTVQSVGSQRVGHNWVTFIYFLSMEKCLACGTPSAGLSAPQDPAWRQEKRKMVGGSCT